MRFILVGTLNALITVLIVWLMMDKLGCNYIATNITAYVIAQINNFFWSKYWIFSSRTGKFRREIPLFLIAFGCASDRSWRNRRAGSGLFPGTSVQYEVFRRSGPERLLPLCRQHHTPRIPCRQGRYDYPDANGKSRCGITDIGRSRTPPLQA